MSRKLAGLAELIVKVITIFSNNRQKSKIISRLINKLSQATFTTVNCRKGKLRFNQLKSPHVASAVGHFFEDEPETLKWIDSFEDGQTFFDIGAGIGIYSLYAALNPSLRVFSFEPNGFSFGLLVEHIHINEMSENINPFCIAIGDKTERERLLFNQFSEGAGGSSFKKAFYIRHDKDPIFSLSVLSFSLDEFLKTFELGSPDHIKIDVDGIEPQIILGAEKAIESVDSIMLEVEHRTPDQIATLIEGPLHRLGFRESFEFKELGSGRNRLYRKFVGSGG
ncbi:MAG: FkbM family methyltransferase [Pseudomonadota bacterium]|nr:FkbM family methyltransferase [Pseudomonadota bacterium]